MAAVKLSWDFSTAAVTEGGACEGSPERKGGSGAYWMESWVVLQNSPGASMPDRACPMAVSRRAVATLPWPVITMIFALRSRWRI